MTNTTVKTTQDTYYTARMPDGNFETMIQRTIGGIQVTCYIVRSAEKKQTIVANCNQREVSVGRLTGDVHGSNQRLDLQATYKE